MSIFTRSIRVVLLAGLVSCVCSNAPVLAALTPLYENATSELNFDPSIVNNDLVNTGQATLSSATTTRAPSFGFPGINNGVNNSGPTDSTNNNNTFFTATQTPVSVTFRLNTTTNTEGYDLSSIQSLAGWAGINSTQANQKFELLVSQVGSPIFRSLGTFTYTPFTSGTAGSSTRITLTDSTGTLAANIDAVRFNLLPHGVNGNGTNSGTVYRELEVFGTPATTSAPTFVNLVQNGSFEANVLSAGTSSLRSAGTPVSGWTVTGNLQLAYAPFTNTGASDGNQWLSLEANNSTSPLSGTLSQTLVTVPGQEYELSFDYNILNSSSASVTQPWKMTYTIDGVSTDLTLPNTPTNQVFSAWQHRSVTFTATSTSTVLSFAGNAQITGYYGMAIDNVAVVATAVPEPGTTILLIGLCAAGFCCRRQTLSQPARESR